LVEHCCRLRCFLNQCPSCIMARAVGSIRGDECGRLRNVVLLAVVGLLKAALNGDDPLQGGILSLR
jgi:hypothetical protein